MSGRGTARGDGGATNGKGNSETTATLEGLPKTEEEEFAYPGDERYESAKQGETHMAELQRLTMKELLDLAKQDGVTEYSGYLFPRCSIERNGRDGWGRVVVFHVNIQNLAFDDPPPARPPLTTASATYHNQRASRSPTLPIPYFASNQEPPTPISTSNGTSNFNAPHISSRTSSRSFSICSSDASSTNSS